MIGSVAANGSVLEGSGFSVVRNSVGNYTVTFDPNAFTAADFYQVWVQISDSNHKMGFIFVDKVDGSNCTVTTFQTP